MRVQTMTWQDAILMLGIAALASAVIFFGVVLWAAHEAEVNSRA